MMQSWQLLVAFAGLSEAEARVFIAQMNRYLFCSSAMRQKMCEEWEQKMARVLPKQAD